MKYFRLTLGIALILGSLSPNAFSDCRLLAASSINDGLGGNPAPNAGALFTPVVTGTPALMSAGANNQPASWLVIYDDGLGTNCFTAGQRIVATFNYPASSPTSLDQNSLSIYDSQGGTGLLLTGSITTGFPASAIVTINVTRAGTAGNPITSTTGAAFVLKNFKLDLRTAPAASSAIATVSASSGNLVSPQQQVVGTIQAAGPITVAPTTLDFGSQIIGSSSAPKVVQLTNLGTVPLVINSVVASTGFGVAHNCGASLPANAVCSISVTFSPTSFGNQAGTITIDDNAAGNPHLISVSGSGIASPGVPLLTSISPDHVIAGGPTFSLKVTGSNFAPGSTVYWNGGARTTTFVDSGRLTATIPAGDITGVGNASITVVNGTSVSAALTLQIIANPLPTSSFRYTLPHVLQGGGFVTKITLTNLSLSDTSPITVTYLSQAGTLVKTESASAAPLGTVRFSTPESARFGPSTVQTVVVSSLTRLGVNLFFELTDPTGKVVLNTVGFNNVVPHTDFSIPVEFERDASGTHFSRTTGVAIANTADTPTRVELLLLNTAGTVAVGSNLVELPPYGQTAIDLAQVPQFAAAVPAATNVVGTLVVKATQPISAIAVGDDVGPFASTPPVPGRANLKVDDITAVCPTAAEIAQLNADFLITFESDPSAGALVCRAAEGSQDLTLAQQKAYQALRIIRNTAFGLRLPFTAKPLYEWLRGAATGIRFRGDILTSGCCETIHQLDIALNATSPVLFTPGWMGPFVLDNNVGLNGLVAEIVRTARISEGFNHTCSPNDNTLAEMGPWAAVVDFHQLLSQSSGTLFDDTVSGEPATRYRDVSAATVAAFIGPPAGKFCDTTANAQVQPGPALGIDFGQQPTSGLASQRTVMVSSLGTPFNMQTSSLSGTNAADFQIVTDGCVGKLVPPTCTLVLSFQPSGTGARTASLLVGTAPNNTLALTGTGIASTPIPATSYTYLLPHIVTGDGYLTKITLSNLVNLPNEVEVRFISQAGAVLQSNTYTLAAGGALRIATPEAERFGTSSTRWAVVGSRQPLLANLFFEVMNSAGTIVNTIGFNAAPPLSSFSFPVEFEPAPPGAAVGRTAGLAMSNPGGTAVTYTLKLYNQAGSQIALVNGSLPAYGQTAFDLAKNATIFAALPNGNFVGSVQVTASGPVSAIALEDDFGPFSATPVVAPQ